AFILVAILYGYCAPFAVTVDVKKAGESLNVKAAGIGEDKPSYAAPQIAGCGGFYYRAFVEDRDVVGYGFYFVEEVAGEEDGYAVGLEQADHVAEEILSGDRVESERWVVEDYDFGAVSECKEQCQAAVLAF
ncbi:MAG: hypothetical protein KAR47_17520, partial [Planctomycetes bacterium]|nr:hypothetical protein [Planctomycetota bacterium]